MKKRKLECKLAECRAELEALEAARRRGSAWQEFQAKLELLRCEYQKPIGQKALKRIIDKFYALLEEREASEKSRGKWN